jgi:hypothetical protein
MDVPHRWPPDTIVRGRGGQASSHQTNCPAPSCHRSLSWPSTVRALSEEAAFDLLAHPSEGISVSAGVGVLVENEGPSDQSCHNRKHPHAVIPEITFAARGIKFLSFTGVSARIDLQCYTRASPLILPNWRCGALQAIWCLVKR